MTTVNEINDNIKIVEADIKLYMKACKGLRLRGTPEDLHECKVHERALSNLYVQRTAMKKERTALRYSIRMSFLEEQERIHATYVGPNQEKLTRFMVLVEDVEDEIDIGDTEVLAELCFWLEDVSDPHRTTHPTGIHDTFITHIPNALEPMAPAITAFYERQAAEHHACKKATLGKLAEILKLAESMASVSVKMAEQDSAEPLELVVTTKYRKNSSTTPTTDTVYNIARLCSETGEVCTLHDTATGEKIGSVTKQGDWTLNGLASGMLYV